MRTIFFAVSFVLISGSLMAQIFQEGEHIPSNHPTSAAFGDINGNGNIDFVQANSWYTNNVPENANKVWLGNGDSTFTFHMDLGDYPTIDIELIDMDNDGDLDIIAANAGNFLNRIWFNDGLGNFTIGQSFGNRSVTSLATADFNEDGYPDIVFGVNDIGTEDMLFINNGDGTVSFETNIPWTTGSKTSDTRTTDINNDGHIDILLSKGNTNLGILKESEIWTGFGDGTFFKSPQNFPLFGSGSTAVGDYNGDGFKDLIFHEEGNIHGYLNDGTSYFQSYSILFTGESIADIDLIDVDVDGDLDLLIARYEAGDGYVSEILLNNGDGDFTDGSEQISIASTVKIEAYDIDEDNDMDLFTVNRNDEDCVFWINQTDPVLSIPDSTLASLSLYPNPTSDILKFSGNIENPIRQIEIYNSIGVKVFLVENVHNISMFNVSHLASGLYFCEVTTKNQSSKVMKFIKQ